MGMLEELRSECGDRRRVLAVLESELARMDAGESPDLEVMQDALCFLTQYPDVIDNAKETAIQQQLIKRDAATRPLIDALREERAAVHGTAVALLDAVEDMLEDVVVALDAFKALAGEYVALQRHLFDREEQDLLPRARELLQAPDLGTAGDTLRRCRRSKLRNLSRQRFERLVGSRPATRL